MTFKEFWTLFFCCEEPKILEDDFSPNISQSIKANSPSPDFVSPKNISPQSQVAQITPCPTQITRFLEFAPLNPHTDSESDKSCR